MRRGARVARDAARRRRLRRHPHPAGGLAARLRPRRASRRRFPQRDPVRHPARPRRVPAARERDARQLLRLRRRLRTRRHLVRDLGGDPLHGPGVGADLRRGPRPYRQGGFRRGPGRGPRPRPGRSRPRRPPRKARAAPPAPPRPDPALRSRRPARRRRRSPDLPLAPSRWPSPPASAPRPRRSPASRYRPSARPAKSARARSEEQPELALDPGSPGRLEHAASLAAAEPLDHRAPSPLHRRARGERPHARVRARRLRRARRDRRDPSRPGGDHVRTRTRRRPQGVARHRPRRRHRPLDVRPGLPRLDHPRPLRHRHRATQREPREGPAARDPRRQALRRQRPRPAARARQGHRRRARGGEPRPHAAPADRRHHRLGQVGGDQHHDPVAALQARPRGMPADHDRPQDAGAQRLRRHPPPALPGRHRPQEGRRRA